MLANLEFYDSLRFFSADEFKHPEKLHKEFLERLDWARHYAGVPFYISDDYRHGSSGAHGEGRGVDIRVDNNRERYYILRGIVLAGFTRFGVYDKHIHADTSTKQNQEVAWMGKST